jgi:hypothetical protein
LLQRPDLPILYQILISSLIFLHSKKLLSYAVVFKTIASQRRRQHGERLNATSHHRRLQADTLIKGGDPSKLPRGAAQTDDESLHPTKSLIPRPHGQGGVTMKGRNFAICLIVILSIGIFAVAGGLQAAETDSAYQSIAEGAKQMMDGNKKIMAIMEKKGMKDAELTSAEKMMMEGYDMIMKGQAMMATDKTGAQKMASEGGKMMLDAQKKVAAVVEKKGMVQECKIDLSECTYGEQKIKKGALEWFFGAAGV